ncbi:MAG: phosphoribosylformylglycinamidine synthase subunit PurQ, partial [Verrucomicrobia bacterium]|nr:phosphoribosylformylglycinamidine synthase subunit PurQ [Verrucomicrobiota bacterium]
AVLQFPGSNCDKDALVALRSFQGVTAELVWHQDTSLDDFDVIILPGGFSYGDYLRCGAIARFSPIMKALRQAADQGKMILGICNGFQILCEAGFLPGTLIRNRKLLFRCEEVLLRVEEINTSFTNKCTPQQILRLPIAHGEGCYTADEKTLKELHEHHQILFRYCNDKGEITAAANPNGSMENIAGICNRQRNIVGLMPHPERACEDLIGGTDGRFIFESMLASFAGSLSDQLKLK